MSQITKTLLSVSRFASDNNVFFEFFPKYFYVKDQVTYQVLMAGRLKDGLSISYPPQFLANASTSNTKARSDTCQIQSSVYYAKKPYKTIDKSYALSNYSSSHSCSNSSSVFTLWHNRLGRPGSSIVKTVLPSYNIPPTDK